jgi:hypothetical protein
MGYDDADTKFGAFDRPRTMVPGWEAQYRFGPIPGLGAFGRPEALVVLDPRTIRAIDPQLRPGGYYRGDAPAIGRGTWAVTRPQQQELMVPDVRTERAEDIGWRKGMGDTMVVPDVRAERRENLRGLGQGPQVEQLSDAELLDIVKLSSLSSILWITMERATDLLAVSTTDGNRIVSLARGTGRDDLVDSALRLRSSLLTARAELPKVSQKHRELFEATDLIAKVLAARGISTRWAAISVNPQYPSGTLTEGGRDAAQEKRKADFFDPLVSRSFKDNASDLEGTRARVRATFIRAGIPESQLGNPLLIILVIAAIAGLILVAYGATVGVIGEVKTLLPDVLKDPDLKRAAVGFIESLGNAAKEFGKGAGIVVPLAIGATVIGIAAIIIAAL